MDITGGCFEPMLMNLEINSIPHIGHLGVDVIRLILQMRYNQPLVSGWQYESPLAWHSLTTSIVVKPRHSHAHSIVMNNSNNMLVWYLHYNLVT